MPASRGIAGRTQPDLAPPWPFYRAVGFRCLYFRSGRGSAQGRRGSAPECGQRLRRGGAWRAGAAPGRDFRRPIGQERAVGRRRDLPGVASLFRVVIKPSAAWGLGLASLIKQTDRCKAIAHRAGHSGLEGRVRKSISLKSGATPESGHSGGEPLTTLPVFWHPASLRYGYVLLKRFGLWQVIKETKHLHSGSNSPFSFV